jgi:DNA-binding GntR family transcriptional regulator
MELRLRGRMRQSMDEHGAIFTALEASVGNRASAVIRDHIALQGKKSHHLITNLKPAAE